MPSLEPWRFRKMGRANRGGNIAGHGIETHRIHGAGIYANIWYIDGIHVTIYIYSITMDPSWEMG
jgi:hypothetical protein